MNSNLVFGMTVVKYNIILYEATVKSRKVT